MQYFILVMLYTAAMLAVYQLLLRNHTQYQLSRYYLLATAVLPFILPFLQLPAAVRARVGQVAFIGLPEIQVGGAANAAASGVHYMTIVWLVYGLVAGSMLLRCLWQIVHIRRVVRAHTVIDAEGVLLVRTTGYGPGSFGRYVFFPGEEINEMVLRHEQVHVRLHHTRDLVLLALLQSIAWPNLLLVLVRKELAAVHEFQADEVAGTDKQQYMQLLLSTALHTGAMPLTHSFIIHPIKRRIMMLQKNRTTSLLKPVVQVSASLLVMIPAVMAFQSCSKQPGQKQDPKVATGQGNVQQIKFDSTSDWHITVYDMADQQPEYPGGQVALMNFLAANVKYPEDARKKNIQGKVILRFAVSDEGKVLDPEVVRSPDPSLSAAALDAVKQMPLWKPGMKDGTPVCIAYTLPVSFRLDN